MDPRFQVKLIAPIKILFQEEKKIVITTHHRPDGDAIGSSLGLYNYLIQKKHQVNVVVPSNYPSFLKWMPNNDVVINYEADPEKGNKLISEADIIFCLDYNAMKRIDKMEMPVRNSKAIKILIDHHLHPENAFDHSYSFPDSCATSELIYEFIVALDDQSLLNKSIAECLYTGIMTDTASFRFAGMKAETHRTVAKLMEAGAVNYKIHELVYDTNTEDRIRLLGHCLKDKLVVLRELNTAYISLTEEELNHYQFESGDTEGIVNYALSINNIMLAAFFAPRDGVVRISFRSKDNFPANELSQKYFEGGGHRNAAGGRSELSLDETIKKFVGILPEYKSQLVK
ncbi:bifunctional oligoribonuclease/PAP phosphatase NrnA [soil metagenome]